MLRGLRVVVRSHLLVHCMNIASCVIQIRREIHLSLRFAMRHLTVPISVLLIRPVENSASEWFSRIANEVDSTGRKVAVALHLRSETDFDEADLEKVAQHNPFAFGVCPDAPHSDLTAAIANKLTLAAAGQLDVRAFSANNPMSVTYWTDDNASWDNPTILVARKCALGKYFEYHSWDPTSYGLEGGSELASLSLSELKKLTAAVRSKLVPEDLFVTYVSTALELQILIGKEPARRMTELRSRQVVQHYVAGSSFSRDRLVSSGNPVQRIVSDVSADKVNNKLVKGFQYDDLVFVAGRRNALDLFKAYLPHYFATHPKPPLKPPTRVPGLSEPALVGLVNTLKATLGPQPTAI